MSKIIVFYCITINQFVNTFTDSKVHGANMGPTWGPVGPRWALCWPHEPCYQACYVPHGKIQQQYQLPQCFFSKVCFEFEHWRYSWTSVGIHPLSYQGGHLNIKMLSYQYRDPHENPQIWERQSLYWDRDQKIIVSLSPLTASSCRVQWWQIRTHMKLWQLNRYPLLSISSEQLSVDIMEEIGKVIIRCISSIWIELLLVQKQHTLLKWLSCFLLPCGFMIPLCPAHTGRSYLLEFSQEDCYQDIWDWYLW